MRTRWNVYCGGRLTARLTTPDTYTAEEVRADLSGDIPGVVVTRDRSLDYEHETIEADRFVEATSCK